MAERQILHQDIGGKFLWVLLLKIFKIFRMLGIQVYNGMLLKAPIRRRDSYLNKFSGACAIVQNTFTPHTDIRFCLKSLVMSLIPSVRDQTATAAVSIAREVLCGCLAASYPVYFLCNWALPSRFIAQRHQLITQIMPSTTTRDVLGERALAHWLTSFAFLRWRRSMDYNSTTARCVLWSPIRVD